MNTFKCEEGLLCYVCNEWYDLLCANISQERYTHMIKDKWMCPECLYKQPKSDNTNTPVRSTRLENYISADCNSSPPNYANVTLRTKRPQSTAYMKCTACRSIILDREEYQSCMLENCSKVYHVQCISAESPTKRDTKTWICAECEDSKNTDQTHKATDLQTNFSEFENELLTQTMDDSATSIPEVSNDDIYNQELITKLKEKIDILTLQLISAEEKIEILTIENKGLTQTNEELSNENKLYIKNTKSPTNQIKNKLPNPKKIDEKLASKQTQTEQILNGKKIHNKGTQTTEVASMTANNQNPIINLQHSPPHSKDENEHLSKKKSKICIISENKYNKIRTIAENKLQQSELCHYIMPYSGINNIICDLEPKLKKFTLEDYCIILIGETDFKTTKEYLSLISKIRDRLKIFNIRM